MPSDPAALERPHRSRRKLPRPEHPDWLIEVKRSDELDRRAASAAARQALPQPHDPEALEWLTNAILKHFANPSANYTDAELLARANRIRHAMERPWAPRQDRYRRDRDKDEDYCIELLPPQGTECGLVSWHGFICESLAEVNLTVTCRVCGPVKAQVCVEHFDQVPFNIDPAGDELRCTVGTPGKHQIVHLVEASYAAAED